MSRHLGQLSGDRGATDRPQLEALVHRARNELRDWTDTPVRVSSAADYHDTFGPSPDADQPKVSAALGRYAAIPPVLLLDLPRGPWGVVTEATVQQVGPAHRYLNIRFRIVELKDDKPPEGASEKMSPQIKTLEGEKIQKHRDPRARIIAMDIWDRQATSIRRSLQ